MDWSKSYSASWRVFRVNRATWADGEMLGNVDSISVSRTADGKLIESGSIKLTGDFETDYYRIVMTAQQGDEIERVDVATLLFEANGGRYDYGLTTIDIDGRSVLYPAETTAVVTGEYAPARADGVLYARDLLKKTINAPVEVEGSFVLNDHIVHELGSTVLEAVWSVLEAGGYILQIDGMGVVHIRPKPTEPSLIIDTNGMSIMSNGIDFDSDRSEIPNRYIVMTDNVIVTAVNNDEQSPVSAVSRGYYVDVIDTSPTPVDGETLGEYANKRLHQLSLLKDTRSYKREYAPNVFPYSLIRASIDGLSGDYRVESQSINCDNGITITEKASMETSLW